MDDELEALLVEVRANTDGFRADIETMRSAFDTTVVEGFAQAGTVLERGLVAAIRRGTPRVRGPQAGGARRAEPDRRAGGAGRDRRRCWATRAAAGPADWARSSGMRSARCSGCRGARRAARSRRARPIWSASAGPRCSCRLRPGGWKRRPHGRRAGTCGSRSRSPSRRERTRRRRCAARRGRSRARCGGRCARIDHRNPLRACSGRWRRPQAGDGGVLRPNHLAWTPPPPFGWLPPPRASSERI